MYEFYSLKRLLLEQSLEEKEEETLQLRAELHECKLHLESTVQSEHMSRTQSEQFILQVGHIEEVLHISKW